MLLVFLFIFLWELLLASIREEKNNLSDGFKLKLIITYQLWFSVCLDKTYITENWKYWNKIIFKYINSDVKPICNENFVKIFLVVGTIKRREMLCLQYFHNKF